MRFKTLALASALAACPWMGFAQTGVQTAGPNAPTVTSNLVAAASATNTSFTLAEAWRLALDGNAALRTKQAQLAAAQGALDDARSLLYNNPELSVEATRREVPQAPQPTERRREWAAGLSQTFEIAGQQGHRHAQRQHALVRHHARILRVRGSAECSECAGQVSCAGRRRA